MRISDVPVFTPGQEARTAGAVHRLKNLPAVHLAAAVSIVGDVLYAAASQRRIGVRLRRPKAVVDVKLNHDFCVVGSSSPGDDAGCACARRHCRERWDMDEASTKKRPAAAGRRQLDTSRRQGRTRTTASWLAGVTPGFPRKSVQTAIPLLKESSAVPV